MTKRSVTLYGSPTKLSNAHKLVSGPLQPKYYVRAEFSALDYSDAFKRLRPRKGEVVLNTVPLPEDQKL